MLAAPNFVFDYSDLLPLTYNTVVGVNKNKFGKRCKDQNFVFLVKFKI